jgi:hypothetical protein
LHGKNSVNFTRQSKIDGSLGRLPDSLDQVKIVPIPIDPYTGKPFRFEATGESAELAGEVPGSPVFGLTYRITLRK